MARDLQHCLRVPVRSAVVKEREGPNHRVPSLPDHPFGSSRHSLARLHTMDAHDSHRCDFSHRSRKVQGLAQAWALHVLSLGACLLFLRRYDLSESQCEPCVGITTIGSSEVSPYRPLPMNSSCVDSLEGCCRTVRGFSHRQNVLIRMIPIFPVITQLSSPL